MAVVLSLVINATGLYAQPIAKMDDILASISTDIQHYTEVATVTKQNEAYQPYIISVFQGQELEKLGVANLKEALLLVPGVDMATDNVNTKHRFLEVQTHSPLVNPNFL